MSRRIVSALLIGNLVAAFATPVAAGASATQYEPVRVRHIGPDYNGGRPLPLAVPQLESWSLDAGRSKVGDTKTWFALDDEKREIYTKPFELRARGSNVEVWVTPDLSFPADDCRNDERIQVTERQVNYLVKQFDGNIYPKESRAFSRPPDRNGQKAEGTNIVGGGPDHFRGDGDDIVVLVDNVRDRNYYDPNNQSNLPYIIGFFYSEFNRLTDRNVMTIDGYDWIHRTGENPPHEPDPTDLCKSQPARPNLIEQTLAHEYQHLLEHYEDPNEAVWLNEGLSDWAQTLTGYAHPERSIHEAGFDRHVQCFLGYCGQQTAYNPNPTDMGPENSLTVWEDQEGEILAEYGATYTFMELLSSRYGRPFMKMLHRIDANGLGSVRRALRKIEARATVKSLIRDWAAAMTLDGVIDDGATLNSSRKPSKVTVRRLDATVNWSTEHAYSTPGAPPNGSDFVRLRDSTGLFFTAAEIESLTFDSTTDADFTLQLVAYDAAHTQAWLAQVPLGPDNSASVSGAELDEMIGTTADTVAAIVTVHDPRESSEAYPNYRLTVNGTLQPGGS
ncbi:MAG: hypothetical protein M3N53_05630 [Actinomycetota bacterium]|nr:hypothetical protein [Actinomycetota bacterium]